MYKYYSKYENTENNTEVKKKKKASANPLGRNGECICWYVYPYSTSPSPTVKLIFGVMNPRQSLKRKSSYGINMSQGK